MTTYRVTYSEVGGWQSDEGTIEAESVADALDILEETVISTKYRVNTVGDCWEWSGESYVARSDAHERDGFGYVDFSSVDEEDEDGAPYSWIVQAVRQSAQSAPPPLRRF